MAKTGTLALTEEVLQQCIDLAGKGATNQLIARAAGVHPDSYQIWVRKGREEPHPEEGEGSIFYRLYNGVENARAMLGVQMAEKVIQAANSGMPNTWQAAMTFLERRYPADWGKRDTTRIEGADGGNLQLPNINVLVLNDSDARSAHEDLLRSLSAAASPSSVSQRVSNAGSREIGPGDGELVDVVDSR